MSSSDRAVVIVSGGAAVSPFTTPDAACTVGLPAGNTGTFLREGLLASGLDVFTCPAMTGQGRAVADTEWRGFEAPPEVLPGELTVNSVGSIDAAGASLARFLGFLAERHGYGSFDLVGHSMGGLFSRAALRVLRDAGSPLAVRSLTTIGTPWTGSFAAAYALGDLDLAGVGGDPRFEGVLASFAEEAAATPPDGASEQVTGRYLAGPGGWNARQAGLLDGLTVTLVAGDAFGPHRAEGASRQLWPNDGLVALDSALAADVPASVLPHRATHTVPDAHSIFFAEQFGLPWERALTWDPAVLDLVRAALA